MDLMTKTLELARRSDLPKDDICREIGVTRRWYDKVLCGQIQDPSVRRIQRLYDLLTKDSEDNAA